MRHIFDSLFPTAAIDVQWKLMPSLSFMGARELLLEHSRQSPGDYRLTLSSP